MITSLGRAASAFIIFLAAVTTARAESLAVSVFPGIQNLPLLAAQAQGFFTRRNLTVEVKVTANSDDLRNGLAAGRFHIVHAAVDNAVAMKKVAESDVAVVMGGDTGATRLFVRPEIAAVTDLRGRDLAVDALDTAYAFQLYAMLRQDGLSPSDYRPVAIGNTIARLRSLLNGTTMAAILNPPFSVEAERSGLRDLGLFTERMGPYQGTAAFVLRPWAAANREALASYLAAYIEGVRWTLDPRHREEVTDLIAKNLKVDVDVARASYLIAVDPRQGLAPDAALDQRGFENVLRLRALFVNGSVGTAADYLDLQYYQAALALLP